MRLIDTTAQTFEKRPGWRGCVFSSDNMTFAHWRFAKGAQIQALITNRKRSGTSSREPWS